MISQYLLLSTQWRPSRWHPPLTFFLWPTDTSACCLTAPIGGRRGCRASEHPSSGQTRQNILIQMLKPRSHSKAQRAVSSTQPYNA